MGQTLAAFLAMSMVMSFSLNQLQGDLAAKRDMMNAEYEVMANAIATDMLQRIGTKPFDANMAVEDFDLRDFTENDLTTGTGFGLPENATGDLIDAAADIDDFHNMPTHNELFLTESGHSIPFDVDISVSYVDGAGNASYTPTWFKEVTLTISEDGDGAVRGILRQPIVIKRRFSPL